MTFLAPLQKGPKIGEGAFGDVFLCVDPVQGKVAAKQFYAANFNSKYEWEIACQKALTEAQRLKALEHVNTLRVHNVFVTKGENEFLIVTEFCDAGTAKDLVASNRIIVAESKRIVRDAAIGLSYVHSSGFIHRDIKPENIFLKSTGEVKVGDFGFLTDKLQFGFATPYGTPLYWAPEVLADMSCSVISDIYSLGSTFFHLLCGDTWLFRDGNRSVLRVGELGYPFIAENAPFLPHVSKSWRRAVRKLMSADKSKRCKSMDEAVNIIAKLHRVEPWVCDVSDAEISWSLERGERKISVLWKNYFRHGDAWVAWSEDLAGNRRRKLGQSPSGSHWRDNYLGLQKFFEVRIG